MEKFEYYHKDFLVETTDDIFLKISLNLLGDDGWELISIRRKSLKEKKKKLEYVLVKKYTSLIGEVLKDKVEEKIEEELKEEITKLAVEYNPQMSEEAINDSLNNALFTYKLIRKLEDILNNKKVDEILTKELISKVIDSYEEHIESNGGVRFFGLFGSKRLEDLETLVKTEADDSSDTLDKSKRDKIIDEIERDNPLDIIDDSDIIDDDDVLDFFSLDSKTETKNSGSFSDLVEKEGNTSYFIYECFFKRKVM